MSNVGGDGVGEGGGGGGGGNFGGDTVHYDTGQESCGTKLSCRSGSTRLTCQGPDSQVMRLNHMTDVHTKCFTFVPIPVWPCKTNLVHVH